MSIIPPDKPLGDYRAIVLARARKRVEASHAGGGAVTALLAYLLDHKIVDGVVTARRIKGFKGELTIVQDSEELYATAGDLWAVLPYTAKLKEALQDEKLKRVAFVGLPCQAQFLYQMRLFPLLETDFVTKIYLVISLFCLGTFATEAFLETLRTHYNLEPEKVENITLEQGQLKITYDNKTINIPVHEVLPHLQTGCLVCPDYTGVFSDISAGLSETHPGYTVLIVRTSQGEQAIREATEKGYLETVKAGTDVIEELKMKAQSKITRAAKHMSLLL